MPAWSARPPPPGRSATSSAPSRRTTRRQRRWRTGRSSFRLFGSPTTASQSPERLDAGVYRRRPSFVVSVAAEQWLNVAFARGKAETGKPGAYQLADDIWALLVDRDLGLPIVPLRPGEIRPELSESPGLTICNIEFATEFTAIAPPPADDIGDYLHHHIDWDIEPFGNVAPPLADGRGRRARRRDASRPGSGSLIPASDHLPEEEFHAHLRPPRRGADRHGPDGLPLPAEGAFVDADSFWHRRLAKGEVARAEPPAEEK